MKKLFLTLSFLSFVFIFISCKKDDSSGDSVTARIQHRWNFIQEIDKGSGPGNVYVDTTKGLPGDFVDFRQNNTAILKYQFSADTVNYQLISNDTKLVFSTLYSIPDTFDIQVLTNSNLQLYNKYVFGNQVDESTLYLTR